jgi:transcriptional regulator with XRE-family HTH domain
VAIKKEQRPLRKKLLASAIRELRARLEWTQLSLAIALKVEPGMVSRWERGTLSPHRSYLARLKKLAEKQGLDQLVQILNDPIPNWKSALALEQPLLADLITRLEIVAMNGSMFEDEDSDDHNLRRVVAHIEGKLVGRYTAGEEIFFWTDAQREMWLKVLAEHAASTAVDVEVDRDGKSVKREGAAEKIASQPDPAREASLKKLIEAARIPRSSDMGPARLTRHTKTRTKAAEREGDGKKGKTR